MTKRGLKPGDEEWERLGISRYVTWPRTVCSILGRDVNGTPISGYYGVDVEHYVPDQDEPKKYIKKKVPAYPGISAIKMSDGFATNCEYFKLGFLDKTRVSLGMQFREILTLLWMRAGAKGKRPEIEGEEIPDMLVLPENGFAVLNEETMYSVFVKKLSEAEGIQTVFFVTNSDSAFREMSDGIEQDDTYQLYKDYLENFMIGARRTNQ